MSTKEKHLVHLSQLKGYKVDNHDHDIRGWKLLDRDKKTIGKVDNLLVNKELGKVVYVDVQVEQDIIDKNHDPYSTQHQSEFKEFINKEGENHIIIPIGLIDINATEKYVFTDGIDYQTFAETKRYRSGTDISRNYEHHVLGSYNRDRDHNNHDELHKTENTDHNHSTLDESIMNENRDHGYDKLSEEERRVERERENMQYSSEDRKAAVDTRIDTGRDDRQFLDRKAGEELNTSEKRTSQDDSYSGRSLNESRKPIDDHHRSQDFHVKHTGFKPEKSIDEDQQWQHDDRNLDDPEDFYSRREFIRRK
ncbi:PRC-barrel domain-containing protein [Christiangramia sp. ASW11-125]|uniref:PRC-barrel domain-containing protein n=1 Tax=Christiangramia sp. ASW11-125 TaxID=3400701 RepID=UPI003AAB0FAD